MVLAWRSADESNARVEVKLRGPLALSEVEEELAELKSMLRVPSAAGGSISAGWDRLKSEYREGDELYFWLLTKRPSYSQFWGYVLVREDEIVTSLLTGL
jgi:hypothetical protein